MENKITIQELILSIIVSVLVCAFVLFIDEISDVLPSQLENVLIFMWLFAFPMSPVVYGWITRDKVGAVIVGVIPYIGFILYLYLSSAISHGPPGPIEIIEAIINIVFLSLLGGLEGYFAAKRRIGHLMLAIALALVWFGIFLAMLIADSTLLIITILFATLCFWILRKASF